MSAPCPVHRGGWRLHFIFQIWYSMIVLILAVAVSYIYLFSYASVKNGIKWFGRSEMQVYRNWTCVCMISCLFFRIVRSVASHVA
ncbi:hypothetical protein BC939DRAFT_453996 [Gamsiella multidivaricata]|uniref:uncharacterized protein n=1 Tax=Gamsiella multidivaricata TaxID=101098 RepID=UPI0022202937|nr:uncharacterized protein BC939DRAFT_453996 [Gamsiella multidivaricata]KAI7822392.1 hypothetical protein BC939DRAFT_453996 [Gamsiella multidivaricata]